MEWTIIALVATCLCSIWSYFGERRERKYWQEKYRTARAEAAMWEQTARKKAPKRASVLSQDEIDELLDVTGNDESER